MMHRAAAARPQTWDGTPASARSSGKCRSIKQLFDIVNVSSEAVARNQLAGTRACADYSFRLHSRPVGRKPPSAAISAAASLKPLDMEASKPISARFPQHQCCGLIEAVDVRREGAIRAAAPPCRSTSWPIQSIFAKVTSRVGR
jgi:hypothetical protein